MINVNTLRDTLIALLDDEDGISCDGYDALRGFVSSLGYNRPITGSSGNKTVDEQCGDIWAAVEANDNRHYLPENHGLQ